MFSEIRPNGSQKYASYFTWKGETNCSRPVFYDLMTAEFPGHEDRSEWQRRKTRLQWLMWPSTQRIGKVIRASSYFSTRRVVDLVPEACSTAMTEDRHDELAAIDLSMIVVALTPSWLVWILTVMPGKIFIIPVFLFCFWTRNFIYYTSVSCVWFLLPYVNWQSN